MLLKNITSFNSFAPKVIYHLLNKSTMRKRIMLMFAVPALLLIVSTTSCNSKTSDADVKTAVDKAIAANAGPSTVSTSVNDGVVTLSGEVKDEATKTAAETAARGVNGVKSVTNNLSITPPPVVITADDPLKASVDNTIKPYPGVNATIQNGVITLTGEIKRADLQQLMAALNSLKPKSIENKLTIKS